MKYKNKNCKKINKNLFFFFSDSEFLTMMNLIPLLLLTLLNIFITVNIYLFVLIVKSVTVELCEKVAFQIVSDEK